MKRILALFLCLALLVCFAACTSKINKIIHPPVDNTPADSEPDEEIEQKADEDPDEDLPSFAILADVFKVAPQEKLMTSVTETYYICVFPYNEEMNLRVIAEMTEETYESAMQIDIFDDNARLTEQILVSPLKVISVENLSKRLPSQEELDAFIGKKLADLTAAGYEVTGYYCWAETSILYVTTDLAEYSVVFDGIVPTEVQDADDFDTEKMVEAVKEFPIKSIAFECISDLALNIDEE